MRLLFVDESWMGSSARSLKEALRRLGACGVDEVDEVNEDLYVPRAGALLVRAVNRVLAPAYRRELARELMQRCRDTRPDVLMVYKGSGVDPAVIRSVKKLGIYTVNLFPDYSPHAYSDLLRQAIGEYDLVISTKPYHPSLWKSIYGFDNPCVFVPHGYDSTIHLIETPPTKFEYDLGLIATWRPEYDVLMRQVASRVKAGGLRVTITGNGWVEHASAFPSNWHIVKGVTGYRYARQAQRSKILISPVMRDVVINGQRQPGDEDSTRTYELAAANCFFIHRRTDYVQTVYDEENEVPFFEDAEELVKHVQDFLAEDALRYKMAAAAHWRAVPAYSIDSRAKQISEAIHVHAGF